ncbi:PAS domain S-box protein [Siculibacillus lacustris]|uniref:histidine kinase n=2 Tax=Siculibacillus lacustris TaxID=1549641 RepID=A0A4Q9VJN2_9HYPH|nr:PAS domain S-box protein [Siculibacillus lacustris]
MPLAAILAIVALLGSLVWFADRSEREEARDALIRDALWVEQALRFQIEAARDSVERLALDLAAGPVAVEGVAARLRTLIATHQEVAGVDWFDAEGRVELSVPPADPAAAPAVAPELRMRGFGLAHAVPGTGYVVDLVTPVQARATRVGTLVTHVRLDRLVTAHVPWWITQNSRVALTARDGVELAAKSSLDPGPVALRHELSFDPPLPDVVLVLAAHHRGTNLARNSLVAAILGLAAVAVGSLVALMRHYRRRLDAEQSLEEAEALRRAMEESLTVGMRARDLDGRIIYVNPAFCRMVGFRAEELVGHPPPMPYWLPDLVDETLARHKALTDGTLGPSSFETRFRRADGSIFDVLVYEARLVDADGVHRGWMGSIIDVTARKRAEELDRLQTEKLTHTARLITMGEMASTLSHELNQPLAAIASYAAGCLNLLRDGRSGGEMITALEKVEAQARRAGGIIRRVHDFVRKREPRFAPLDVAELIGDLAAFVTPDARKAGVEIEIAALPPNLTVEADRILMEQVLLNLMRNGIEAMAATPAGDRRLGIAAQADDGHVVVSIADRGSGVDPTTADRLFTPFFTTKPEGMGMGLNICRTIVELHQGRLDFTARPGGGTIFAVTLPLKIREATA